jgi:menaquinone-9 beta-reductase
MHRASAVNRGYAHSVQDRYDTIVIGGGPAGSHAASLLARTGWRVALVEKGPRHRDKACGHCLNPRAFPILDRAGLLDSVHLLAPARTRRLRVHRRNQRPLSATLKAGKQDLEGVVIARRDFDQLLLDHAKACGVDVLQPATARVVEVAESASIIEVSMDGEHRMLRAGLIIGADGLRSAVASAAGLHGSRRIGRKYGFSCAITVESSDMELHRDAIEMFVMNQGYLGIVRTGDRSLHLAGLVGLMPDGGADRDPLAFVGRVAVHFEVLGDLGLADLRLEQVDHFVAAGPMPCRPREVANGYAALIGDAAGYVEPFTGEGITWALHSAEILADVLAQVSPGIWNLALAARYAARWRALVARRHRICDMLARTLDRPRIWPWMLTLGASYPWLTRQVVRKVMAT